MKSKKTKPAAAPENVIEKDAIENAPESGTLPESKNDATEETVEAEPKKKQDEYLERYQRTLAEFDNFRKRTMREKASMYDDGIAACALKFLPVIDNLSRAIDTGAGAGRGDDSFVKGVEMILKQMTDVLGELGITAIDAAGKPFDPNLHSAVMHVEDDTLGENVVAEELIKGYMFKDKPLRHSVVKAAN